MKSHFSRRDFLKSFGALGGFLAAHMAGFVPELQLDVSNNNDSQPQRLSESQHRRLMKAAEGSKPFRELQDYLTERGFKFREPLTEAFRFQNDEMESDLLMCGFDGPRQGASLFFMTVNDQVEVFNSSIAYVVNEAVYLYKDVKTIRSPEATMRMKGVPRLPQEPPTKERATSFFTGTVEASHCPCHDQWSSCYAWNALCAAMAAGCFLNPALCVLAAGACISATANCTTAALCGPAC